MAPTPLSKIQNQRLPRLEPSLQQARKWLQDCLETHSKCRTLGITEPPTRLIDVGADGDLDPPFLCCPSKGDNNAVGSETSNDLEPVNYQYTALSYCWGKAGNIRTTSANIVARKIGIPWSEIPLTILDAILLTRWLGIRYIWIDALCIIQEGPDGDWSTESGKMADVYGNSYLTIAAAYSRDVQGGMFHDVKASRLGSNPRTVPLQNEPLYARGWALQERMLSVRVLILASDQLYWDCRKKFDSVSPVKRKDGLINCRVPDKSSNRANDWQHVVREYCSRDLTCESDKLPALSGIANMWHRVSGGHYLAGIWEENVIAELLWRQQWVLYGQVVVPNVPSEYRAPSWSWASVDGNYYRSSSEEDEVKSTLLSHDIKLRYGTAPFGEVLPGSSISLRGPLLHAKITAGKISMKDRSSSSGSVFTECRSPLDAQRRMKVTRYPKLAVHEAHIETAWCLLLAIERSRHSWGLILLHDSEMDTYSRMGVFVLYDNSKAFDECEDVTVKLV